jgi:hypothetical protein
MWTRLDEMDAWCSQLRIQVDAGVASSEFDSLSAPLFIWRLESDQASPKAVHGLYNMNFTNFPDFYPLCLRAH